LENKERVVFPPLYFKNTPFANCIIDYSFLVLNKQQHNQHPQSLFLLLLLLLCLKLVSYLSIK